MKSILIDDIVHQKLKETSEKTGLKIKVLTETGILYYIKHIKMPEELNLVNEAKNGK